MKKTSKLRRALRFGVRGLLATAVLFATLLLVQGWQAFGQKASGARLLRMQRSPQFHDGHFVNPQPIVNDYWGLFYSMTHGSEHARPEQPVPVAKLSPDAFSKPPSSGLRVTWFGHSSMLIELDGVRVLSDPMWSEHAGPIPWLGPERWFPPPLQLEQLPPLDAVIISHDHYDHLDHSSVLRLNALGVKFVVPLGVGQHLEYWGVPAERIVELDWWERHELNGVTLVCTPARHASGRLLFDRDTTLWAGYALLGPQHRVYYSGDTGLFPAMKEIGEKLGPFDLAMIETGQYNRAWPDWHIGPEQAVQASQRVRAHALLPVHWALLQLAFHGWTEPVERSVVAAEKRHEPLLTPRPGQPFEPTLEAQLPRWWPAVPWETADQHPIVSSRAD